MDGGEGGTDPNDEPCNGNGVLTEPQQPGITDPNGCEGIPSVPTSPARNTPCKDLKAKSDNTEFQNNMQELSQDAGGFYETARVMYKNNPIYDPKVPGGVDSNGNSTVKLPYDPTRIPDITGFMHCHLNRLDIPLLRTLTVFSISDFLALSELVKNSTAPTHQLGMYVTTERGTFAVKLTDKQAIIDFAAYIKSNEGKVKDHFDNEITWDMTKERQINGLLNLIKDSGVGAGIDLYESDANFKNWKKHYLDENNDLKTLKCI